MISQGSLGNLVYISSTPLSCVQAYRARFQVKTPAMPAVNRNVLGQALDDSQDVRRERMECGQNVFAPTVSATLARSLPCVLGHVTDAA